MVYRLNIILLLSILLSSVSCIPRKSPIVFDTMEYDFGTISQNLKLPFEFTVTNRNTAPFRFTGYHVECGCTEIQIPQHDIKPGQSEVIKGVFNSGKYTGMISKKISLLTDNQQQSTITLMVKADVQAYYTISETNITIFDIKNQPDIIKRQVEVHPLIEETLEITEIKPEVDFVKAYLSKPEKDKEIIDIEVIKNKIPQFNYYMISVKISITIHCKGIMRENIYIYIYSEE
ncbi:MAG: DUF1573 domain-containing protein [Spirochaetales bacterium]|nr:DUF1573 domain-containing protein [Spirochaetales bacterium]